MPVDVGWQTPKEPMEMDGSNPLEQHAQPGAAEAALGALTGDAGDTSSLNSRKITLAMMEHKGGPCGSASKEESPGLSCSCCCWDRACSERRGALLWGAQPHWAGTEQKELHRWVVTSWTLQEGLGVAVGAKIAEFSSSHYSLENHSCWNTAGPEEVSIQELISILFLKSYEAIIALLCLLPDWEASCCVWKHSALLFYSIYKKMLNKKEAKFERDYSKLSQHLIFPDLSFLFA